MSNNKIILKRSSVSGKKPTADQLDYGEISLNYADGEVYYKSNKNEIKAIGEQYATEIETLKNEKLGKDETAAAAEKDSLGNTITTCYIESLGFAHNSDNHKLYIVGLPPRGLKGAVAVPEFVGATDSANGKNGLVPIPSAGDNKLFLRGDGTWATLAPTFDSDGNRINGYIRSVQLGNTKKGGISIAVADGQGMAVETATDFGAAGSVPGMVAIGSNLTLNDSTHTVSLTKDNVVAALGYTPPETGATYSAGTGISLDSVTNTFSNSGVLSVVSSAENSFKVNTSGQETTITISNVPSANQATADAKGNVITDTYATKAELDAVSTTVSINSSFISTNNDDIASLKNLSNLSIEGLAVIDDIAKKVVAATEPDLSVFALLSGSTFTGSVTIPTLTVTERVKLPTIIEQDTEITESRTISNMSVSTHYVELGDNVTVTVDDDATWVIK